MKCMNCETNIPSDWQAAISANICPKCGNQIMGEEIKAISDKLKNAISDLILLGQENMDLILDSFGLCRKELIKSKQLEKPDDLPPGLKVAQNKVYDFLSRSKAPYLTNRQEQMKQVLSRINAATDDDIDNINDIDIDDEVEEYIREKEGFEIKQILGNNSLTTGGEPLQPQEEQLLNIAMDNLNQDYDPTIHPALQEERIKRLTKSRQVAAGIRSGKGGFSRSG